MPFVGSNEPAVKDFSGSGHSIAGLTKERGGLRERRGTTPLISCPPEARFRDEAACNGYDAPVASMEDQRNYGCRRWACVGMKTDKGQVLNISRDGEKRDSSAEESFPGRNYQPRAS